MIRVKDRMVTVSGEKDDVMAEFCMLTMGITAAIGVTETLAAFVKGLEEGSKQAENNDEEETE